MPVTEAEATKTCLITLVEPGSSDKVIKLYPAEHDTEKIWLDNARGIDRWNAIKRLMNNHAKRGTAIPDPRPWHSNPKDLRSPDLKPEDIPMVRLEGAHLEKLPEEAIPPFQPKNSMTEMNKRMDNLENMVGSLATSISHLASAIAGQTKPSELLPSQGIPSEPTEEPKRRGRPKKESNEG